MAQSLKEIKSRIRGIGNVNKVTHAMEMISIAKLRPVKNRLLAAKRFSLKIEELLRDLKACAAGVSHPLMEGRENIKKIAKTGVDRISIGKLTRSAPSIDFSLEI